MNAPSRPVERRPAPAHPVLLALAAIALVGAAGCGSSGPSAAASPVIPALSSTPASITPEPSASPIAAADGDWLGFHGDASRAGLAGSGPTGHPTLNWQYRAKAAVPNNISIVGDQVSFASDDGTVYALDRATGAERWVVAVGSAPLVGPFAADGRLYFLNGAGAAIALDASDGHTVWTSTTSYDGPSQLAVDHGTLYFGTSDGLLVAIDGATGAERWNLKPSPSTRRVHTPSVAGGRIFAGTEGGGYVAVDAATHAVAWIGDLGGADTGTAGVADGIAFIGTSADQQTGHLRAFDARTGTPRWTADQPLLQFPTVANDTAYSATAEGLIAAIDLASGATRWTAHFKGKVRPMAIAGSILYLSADLEQKVYALDAATGGKLWSYAVDGGNDCCIAVAHGAVFVGTLAGTVYSIGGDGAAISPEPVAAASPAPVPPSTTPAPTAMAEAPARVVWSTPLDGKAFGPICQIAVDPQGRIWVPEANTDRIAIFSSSGKLLGEWGRSGSGRGEFDFTRTNGDGYGTLAFANDGSFFVLDVGNRRVQHFDAHRQFLDEWGSFGDGPGQFSDPVGIAVAGDGTVWVIDDRRGVVEHYRPDGTVLGSFDAFANAIDNDGSNGLAIDAHDHLYVSQIAPNQVAEFGSDGKLIQVLGQGDFVNQPTQIAVDAAGRVFVTAETSQAARGVLLFGADGTLVGSFVRNGASGTAMSFTAGIAIAGPGAIYVMDSDPAQARLVRFQLGG